MSGYVKLFGSLLASSLMGEALPTRWLFVVMLAMADRDGIVEASVPGLAHLARITIAECEKALAVLAAPDPHSRNPIRDGRRIEATAGGWRLVTYEHFRDKGTSDEAKVKNRARQQRWRDRNALRNAPSRGVTPVTPSEAAAAAAEVKPRARRAESLPGFAEFWQTFDMRVSKPNAERAWRALNPDPELAALITQKAVAYVASTPDKQFRKHAATWLRARGWEDEVIAPSAKSGSARPVEHARNMPVGIPSCACDACIAFRAKRGA